ncbi:HipA-like protein [Bradyrhizobium sp. USDA 4503]
MKDTQKFGGAGETLEVIFGDKLVGLLRRRSEGIQDIEFVYDDAWTADPQAFAVSTRMPLAQRVHEPGVVYRWFLNLLPEGRTLATVGTIPKIPEADVFALLGELGRGSSRRARGVSSRRPAPGADHVISSDGSRVRGAIRRLPEKPLLVGEKGIHMSLAGAQDKLPIVRYPDGGIGLALDGSAYDAHPQADQQVSRQRGRE